MGLGPEASRSRTEHPSVLDRPKVSKWITFNGWNNESVFYGFSCLKLFFYELFRMILWKELIRIKYGFPQFRLLSWYIPKKPFHRIDKGLFWFLYLGYCYILLIRCLISRLFITTINSKRIKAMMQRVSENSVFKLGNSGCSWVIYKLLIK